MTNCFNLLTLGFLLVSAHYGSPMSIAPQRPEIVAVLRLNNLGVALHICAATAISQTSVVTAASCAYDNGVNIRVSLRIRAGSANWDNGGNIYSVSGIRTQGNCCNPGNINNNIAVLITSGTMANVVPIPIGNAGDVRYNQPIVTYGWGFVDYPRISTTEFSALYQNELVSVNSIYCRFQNVPYGILVHDDMFCSELENQYLITDDNLLRQKCFGEAGSPIFTQDGIWVGIRSLDVNCTSASLPSVNFRVSRFLEFIYTG